MSYKSEVLDPVMRYAENRLMRSGLFPTKPIPRLELDRNTFGDTPAAIYLVHRLNELNNRRLLQKVTYRLSAFREILYELTRANIVGILTAHSLSSIIPMFQAKLQAQDEQWRIQKIDPLVINLVSNVLRGELKSILNRTTDTIRSGKQHLVNHVDDEKHQVLFARSKNRLARLKKRCDLY